MDAKRLSFAKGLCLSRMIRPGNTEMHMGLFSFIKHAGKKPGTGGGDEAPEAEAVKKELDSFDLGTQNVQVSVDGDKCVLKGVVADQTAFEKAVVAVGNTLGISKVEAADLK